MIDITMITTCHNSSVTANDWLKLITTGKTDNDHGAPTWVCLYFYHQGGVNFGKLGCSQIHSGAFFYQKCSKINAHLIWWTSWKCLNHVNWYPREDLLQVSGPRGGGVFWPPQPPLAAGLTKVSHHTHDTSKVMFKAHTYIIVYFFM